MTWQIIVIIRVTAPIKPAYFPAVFLSIIYSHRCAIYQFYKRSKAISTDPPGSCRSIGAFDHLFTDFTPHSKKSGFSQL